MLRIQRLYQGSSTFTNKTVAYRHTGSLLDIEWHVNWQGLSWYICCPSTFDVMSLVCYIPCSSFNILCCHVTCYDVLFHLKWCHAIRCIMLLVMWCQPWCHIMCRVMLLVMLCQPWCHITFGIMLLVMWCQPWCHIACDVILLVMWCHIVMSSHLWCHITCYVVLLAVMWCDVAHHLSGHVICGDVLLVMSCFTHGIMLPVLAHSSMLPVLQNLECDATVIWNHL